jgi:hypothetical protein
MMIAFPRHEQIQREKQMKLLLALTTLLTIAVLLAADPPLDSRHHLASAANLPPRLLSM